MTVDTMDDRKRKRIGQAAAAVCLLVLVCTLLPILWISRFAYATGDDLGYGVYVHDVILAHGSIFDALRAMAGCVAHMYNTYQGTWSSILLFQLQPGIWGEHLYGLTVWISLIFILGGTYAFLSAFFEELGFRKSFTWMVFGLSQAVSIQFMPKPRGGLFWYTSVAHYCIPYGAALFGAAAACRYLRSGKHMPFILLCVLFAYLGGAGYPPAVLGLLLVFFAFCYSLTGIHTFGAERREAAARGRRLLIPMALLLAGLAVSAAAPGNKNRGGEDFGLGGSRALLSILEALRRGIVFSVRELLEVRAVWPVFVVLFLLALVFAPGKSKVRPWKRLFLMALGYLAVSAVRTPEVYAGVEVSGGVPDVVWFTLVLTACLQAVMLAWLLRDFLEERGVLEKVSRLCIPAAACIGVVCILGSRFLVGGSVDYSIREFAGSGALSDYVSQMEERLSILNGPEEDVVVPKMNDDQGPFMHMALVEDPQSFTNWVTANYYHKKSVTAVDREAYEAMRETGTDTKGQTNN